MEDLEDLHKLLSNKKNMYFLDDIVSNNIDDTKANLNQAIENRIGHYFCIRNRVNGEYIGSIGYDITAETPLGKVVHLGFFLLPAFHKQGFVVEAARAVINYAFAQDGVIRVTTGCYKDNQPSAKAIIKIGFRLEADKPKAQYHDGVMKDRLEYAVNADEWR